MIVRPTTRYGVLFVLLFSAIASVSLFSRVRAQNSTAGVTQQMIRSNHGHAALSKVHDWVGVGF
jgi:hypothetical protein